MLLVAESDPRTRGGGDLHPHPPYRLTLQPTGSLRIMGAVLGAGARLLE